MKGGLLLNLINPNRIYTYFDNKGPVDSNIVAHIDGKGEPDNVRASPHQQGKIGSLRISWECARSHGCRLETTDGRCTQLQGTGVQSK